MAGLGINRDQVDVKTSRNRPANSRNYIQTVKLQFNCNRCRNHWSTSKGKTVFYWVTRESAVQESVTFKAETFKQDCLRCNREGDVSHYGGESKRIAKKFAERMLQ